MKILQVVNTLDATDGGPARNSFEVNQALNAQANVSAQLWAVSGAPDDSTPAVDSRSGRVLRGPAPAIGMPLHRLRHAMRSCDVVVVHGVYLWWVPFVLFSARLHGKPAVIMPHGAISAYEMKKSAAKKRLFNRVIDLAGVRRARFAVGSKSEADDVRHVRPEADVTVVGVGTTLPDGPPPDRPDGRRELRLLSMSRITSKKRIDLMIDALARVSDRGFTVTLVVAGDGDRQLKGQLAARAQRLGVGARVDFVGHVGAADKIALFRDADIFLLPSEDENFGIGLAEALSHGVPAIVSDRVAAAHEVENGAVQVLHAPTGDSIADAIIEWVDPEVRRLAAESAWREARRVFDWAQVAQKWLSLLSSAVGNGRSNGERNTVVYVSTSYPSYSETFVSAEMERLRDAGWNVLSYSLRMPPKELDHDVPYVATPVGRAGLTPWVLIGIGFRLTRWRKDARLRSGRSPRSLARRLFLDAHAARLRNAIHRRGVRPAGLHAHFLAQPAEVAALAAGELPLVVTVHAADAYVEDTPENRRFVEGISGFRFASRAVERTFNALGTPYPSIVLPCVASLPGPRNPHPPQDDTVRVVTVARLISTKGYRRMMRIIESASTRGRVEWTIVGDGALRREIDDWRSRVEGPRLRISVMGALPHQETLRLVSLADVFFLLPEISGENITKGDGLPVALMEAMACGVPVVSSAAGGIPELVRPGVTGVIVGEADDEAAIQALWAASRTAESERLTAAARELVTQHFSPESNSSTLDSWLSERFASRRVVADKRQR